MRSRLRRRTQASCLLLLCLALACQASGEKAPRNLLLISIDTLRPDRLGAYGYKRPTSPFLDRLAEEGALFENAYATGSWTVPSHASMLTGLYPRSHGMRTSKHVLAEDVETLGTILTRQGFATAGIVNVFLLGPGTGFDRGFSHWVEVPPAQGAVGAAPRVNALALDWLKRQDARPFFLFLHYYDVHSPYRPLDRYRKMLVGEYAGRADATTEQLKRHRRGELRLDERDARHLSELYDAEIRQLDTALERLFAHLGRRGLLDDTLVVLTSDHGEEFLEHGDFMHGRTLFEELVRVPLILRGPGIPRGVRVAAPVSLVDLVPTLASALGVSVPANLEGVDLGLAWRRPESLRDRPLFFAADEWHGNPSGTYLRAVLHGKRKLHMDGLTKHLELFDLAQDPTEHDDLASEQSEIAAELRREIDRHGRSERPPDEAAPLSPSAKRKLKALGYID